MYYHALAKRFLLSASKESPDNLNHSVFGYLALTIHNALTLIVCAFYLSMSMCLEHAVGI